MAAMKHLRPGSLLLAVLLAGCAGAPKKPEPVPAPGTASQPATTPERKVSPYAPAKEDLSKRGNYTAGGLYAPGVRDSAPDELPRVDLIPEPDVVAEPRSRYGNRSPYSVLGKSYHVLDSPEGYRERGIASYYGNKFHGRRTSSLEVYDMYTFSAAHKTLPLPSYARVTNLANGESVVVRVNDRGPFHEGRIIDLSFAAAVKLGIHRTGTAQVEVEALVPGDPLPAAGEQVVAAPPPTGMDALVAALPDEPAPAAVAALEPELAAMPAPAQAASEPARATVELQVASFSSQANAELALARLEAAAITGARVLEAIANDRRIWRVRIGPIGVEDADRLVGRVVALGFGEPHRIVHSPQESSPR